MDKLAKKQLQRLLKKANIKMPIEKKADAIDGTFADKVFEALLKDLKIDGLDD